MAIAIASEGERARSFLAHQLPLRTDDAFGDASVEVTESARILEALDEGVIPVIAGFQGVDRQGNLTTLGRGGSDTTAVAVAAAIDATCEIYTDVEGVFTLDPNVCAGARKLDVVGYDEMFVLAAHGAKVLHAKCVTLAEERGVAVHVKSSLSDAEGTWVRDDAPASNGVVGIAIDRAVVLAGAPRARVTIIGVGVAGDGARVVIALEDAGVDAFGLEVTRTSLSFCVDRDDANRAANIVHELLVEEGASSSVPSRITGSDG
jgi:aspartate kinase